MRKIICATIMLATPCFAAENIPVNTATGKVETTAVGGVGTTLKPFDFTNVTVTGIGAGASVSDVAFATSWNGVTTVAPSKNAIYDWGHIFDVDDDGKVSVLDLTAGIPKTDANGLLSLAVAGTDYAALSFSTIAVSGQSNVVADTAADTLTLAAGSNIVITTNATTDTMTIGVAGAGVGDSISVDGSGVVDPNFDDGGDINFTYSTPNITAAVKADSVALTTDTTGNYVASVATNAPLTGGAAGSEGAVLTLALDQTANYSWTGIHIFDSDGVQLDDTNASHQLILTPGSDLTANRVLTITTGDAARILSITADATISGTNTGDQSGANPTASVGLAAVNGVATTFMRSDGAPAISQSIAPTWTGLHIFNANATIGNAAASSGVLKILEDTDSGSNFASFEVPALVANTVYVLPADDGDAGEQLQTDGSGNLTWEASGGAGGGAPTDADYLVGTANAGLSAEIVAGTSPQGELGGTWASPTIDADAVLWNEIGDAGADATIAMGANETDFTSTIDASGESVLTITNTDADAANDNSLIDLRHNDGADANVFYIRMIGDNDGTTTNDYLFSQAGFTSLLPVNVPAESYDDSGWDGDTGAPQKDAIRDKITPLTFNDYLVGTATASLSGEIVAGTVPGGELGGTWGSPTLDDSVTVATWTMTGAPGLTVNNGATTAGSIGFKEDSDNGTNTATLIGPASTADVTITLPAATDTLVGKDTTDTLTNKSIDAAQLTGEVATARLPAFGSGDVSFAVDGGAGTIAANAVTFAKFQDINTNMILGRATAATGDTEELTALPFADTGDVTRPADSTVTTIADSVTVTGWELGASTATTAAADDNDTSLATTAYVQGELPIGANPTGTVGLSAVNGTTATFLRSDGAPALSQAITPTWSGLHIFDDGVDIKNGATTAGLLRIFEDSDDGTNKATFTVPALTADTAYTLPPDDGDAGEQLQTNGAGVLTWETAGAGGGGDSITVDGAATVDPNFDDGGDINFAYSSPNITATVKADSVALTTDTTGNYVTSVATTSPITGGAAASEGATLTIALDKTQNLELEQTQTVIITNANENGTTSVLTLGHNTTDPPANNMGTQLDFDIETSTQENNYAGSIAVQWSDVTHATRTSFMDFLLVNSGSIGSKMRLFGSGGLSVNNTTDPGAGVISANTGFKIGTTQIISATAITPDASDGMTLGTTTLQFSDLFLAEGGVINWDNGDATLTQAGDVVTVAGADLKVTTPGDVSTSVVTTDGTQTLTNKTIAVSQVTGALGYVMDGGFNTALTPADGTTYYFGYNAGINIAQHATYANTSMTVPKTGMIKTIIWKVFVVTNGSAENATHAIRVNDTTDTTLSTTETYNPGANTQKTFTYTGLSTAVTTGDTITFKVIAPTWTTNPALNSGNLMVYIE